MNTITPAILVESFVPFTKIIVINKTIRIAGKLIQIGIPINVGI